MPTTKSKSKAKAAWQAWYSKNKDSFNEERKRKYAEDPKLRESILAKQREYRDSRPKVESDGRHYKNLYGKTVEVFRIGAVSQKINRDVQVIRLWEREGKIPKPSVPGGHRYYTEYQVALLLEFSNMMTELRYLNAERAAATKALGVKMKVRWKIV